METYCIQRLARVFGQYVNEEEANTVARQVTKAIKEKAKRRKKQFKIEYMRILSNVHLNKNGKDVCTKLLIDGVWTVDKFVHLTHDDLSPEMKEYRHNLRRKRFEKMIAYQRMEKQLDESQPMTIVQEIHSKSFGLLMCGRCKSHNTNYTLLQTRSGDEGSTCFAECFDCGKHWKFS